MRLFILLTGERPRGIKRRILMAGKLTTLGTRAISLVGGLREEGVHTAASLRGELLQTGMLTAFEGVVLKFTE